jgi:hypothetical protein
VLRRNKDCADKGDYKHCECVPIAATYVDRVDEVEMDGVNTRGVRGMDVGAIEPGKFALAWKGGCVDDTEGNRTGGADGSR